MNFVQMSRSLSSFLFTECMAGRPRRGLAYLLADQRRNPSLTACMLRRPDTSAIGTGTPD
jgi:hypothetical protein